MMTRFNVAAIGTVLVGLGALSNVQARGVHERYDPYGFLSSSITAIPIPTPTLSDSAGLTTATDSISFARARRAASSPSSSSHTSSSRSTTTAPPVSTATTISGLEIVAVQPPTSSANVTYMANAFFANWHAASDNSSARTFGLSDLQWDLVDTMTYGYIPVPLSNFSSISLPLSDAALIPQFVDLAAQSNVSAILSFGGHIASPSTGGSASTGFALAMASEESIQSFVTGVADLVTTLGLNGVEFDWEWTPCSTETPYTSAELSIAYLSFLQKLRTALDESVTIGLAVGVVPFETPSLDTTSTLAVNATTATTLTGAFKDVSEFASVLDYITIQNFDLYGAWSTDIPVVLPNSPLNGTCPSSSPSISSALSSSITNSTSSPLPISANTAVASWVLSGFRPDQIVLGVSASGRSYRVAKEDAIVGASLAVYPPYFNSNGTVTDLGDSWWSEDLPSNSTSKATATTSGIVAVPTATSCVLPSELSTVSGVFTFQGLIDAGFLDAEGDVMECQGDDAPEIVGGWDECSETPFVYNVGTGVMVSYDDAESMELKGQFILNTGLRGFQLYEAGGDSSAGILLSAIRHGAGFPESESCLPAGETDWLFAHEDQQQATTEEAEANWETILQTEIDEATPTTTTTPTTTATMTSSSTSSTPDRKRWLRWSRQW